MGLCGTSPPNCTLFDLGIDDSKYHADPDIAGIGIIIAFVASSLVTIAITHASLLFGIIRGYEENTIDLWVDRQLQKVRFLRAKPERTKFWQPIMESVVMTLSDQQLLVGITVLIAGYLKHCSISVYHFTIVGDLAWFSSNTHMTSLNVLVVRLTEQPSLRNWRVSLMVLQGTVLLVAMILQGHRYWYESWNSPAQCLFSDLPGNYSGESAKWSLLQVFFILFGYTTSILRLYEIDALDNLMITRPLNALRHARNSVQLKRSLWRSAGKAKAVMASMMLAPTQIALLAIFKLYLGSVIFLGSVTFSLLFDVGYFAWGLWGIIEDRDIPPSEIDGNENAWGFGQIVSILLLSSIVMAFKEVYENQVAATQKPEPSGEDSVRQIPPDDQHAGQNLGSRKSSSSHDQELEELQPVMIPPKRVDTEAGRRR